MKVSEIKKLLKKAGCYCIREGDNHEIWYSPITNRHLQFQDITLKNCRQALKRQLKSKQD